MIASRKTVLWFLGGAALLTALYLTLDKLKDTLEAQLADRLNQAVDQLRDRNFVTRPGCINVCASLSRSMERCHRRMTITLVASLTNLVLLTKKQRLMISPS